MPINYANMRKTAQRLLRDNGVHNKGGLVEIGRPVTTPGAGEYDPPTTTTTYTEVNAVVTGVSQKYFDGSNIVMSDRQVMFQSPTAFNPAAGDKMRIDGDVVAVLSIMPVLAAGDPVVERVIVR